MLLPYGHSTALTLPLSFRTAPMRSKVFNTWGIMDIFLDTGGMKTFGKKFSVLCSSCPLNSFNGGKWQHTKQPAYLMILPKSMLSVAMTLQIGQPSALTCFDVLVSWSTTSSFATMTKDLCTGCKRSYNFCWLWHDGTWEVLWQLLWIQKNKHWIPWHGLVSRMSPR